MADTSVFLTSSGISRGIKIQTMLNHPLFVAQFSQGGNIGKLSSLSGYHEDPELPSLDVRETLLRVSKVDFHMTTQQGGYDRFAPFEWNWGKLGAGHGTE